MIKHQYPDPAMTVPILVAAVLVALTVLMHATGLSLLLRALMKSHAAWSTQTWPISWLLVRVTWLLVLVHVAEITLWAYAYRWAGCLPDIESAYYFSGVTYTTIGYGDLVLANPWRILGPVEGLTGILMCGLSAGLFFAVVSKVFTLRVEAKKK